MNEMQRAAQFGDTLQIAFAKKLEAIAVDWNFVTETLRENIPASLEPDSESMHNWYSWEKSWGK